MKLNSAILFSVVAHLGLVVLLVLNVQFSKVDVSESSEPVAKINAKAVNSKRVEQLVEKLRNERQEKVRKEKQRLEDIKKAEQAAKQRVIEEQKKAEDARKRKVAAEKQRVAEEKKAADLKKKRIEEEKVRKQKAAEEKKRKADAEKERQAEEERKRKAKEEAERKRQAAEEQARQEALEKEMMRQIEAEQAELAQAKQQQVMSEVAKFSELITNKIRRNWIKPERKGYCRFRISIAPAGLILGVTVLEGDSQHCDTGRRAIFKAEPLPMSKDRDVYSKLKTFTLRVDNRDDDESSL